MKNKAIQSKIFRTTLLINFFTIFFFTLCSDFLIPYQMEKDTLGNYLGFKLVCNLILAGLLSIPAFFVARKTGPIDTILARHKSGNSLGDRDKSRVNQTHFELLTSILKAQALLWIILMAAMTVYIRPFSFYYFFPVIMVFFAIVLFSGLIQMIAVNRIMAALKRKMEIFRFDEKEKRFPFAVNISFMMVVLCQISAGIIFFQWYNNSLYMNYNAISIMKYTSDYTLKYGDTAFEIPEKELSSVRERQHSYIERAALIRRYLSLADQGLTTEEAGQIKAMITEYETRLDQTEQSIGEAFGKQVKTSFFIMVFFLILSCILTFLYTKDFNIQLDIIKEKMKEMLANRRDMTQRLSILTIDEVGQVTSLFNRVLDHNENLNRQLQEVDRLKDEFLANTSHELKTPINGIIGLSQSLLDGVGGELNETIQKNLSMITSSGRRLNHLINDILDFSRLRNRDIRLKRINVNLHETVNTILAITAPLINPEKQIVENKIPADAPWVFGDEDRLHQIFYNIVGNAIKFCESGTITISAAEPGSMMEIFIKDTGMGIPADKHDHIFKSFEQAGTEGSSGTGLGLSITKKLVELHGGEIRVVSEPEKGACFIFTIPKGDIEHKAAAPQGKERCKQPVQPEIIPGLIPDRPHLQVQKALTPANGQVLVVDDEVINLQVVANFLALKRVGHTLISSGEKALETLNEGPMPDLILLDIMMPGMSGIEVLKQLRRKYNPTELVIILLTAKSRVNDLINGFELGANDYITKPFSEEELYARIQTHINLKQTVDRLKQEKILRETETIRKEKALIRIEKEKVEKLRYQLNPHFLFNALASIRGAVLSQREVAHEMVASLADFCRLALVHGPSETVSIQEEMEMIHLYLGIEQARFDDHLKAKIEIDPACLDKSIPALLIQPLIENAIKYGRLSSKDLLEIVIKIEPHDENRLHISISNTGEWIEPGSSAAGESTGVGLTNIRQRLDKLYPDRYEFKKEVRNNRVTFQISIPG